MNNVQRIEANWFTELLQARDAYMRAVKKAAKQGITNKELEMYWLEPFFNSVDNTDHI